MYKRVIATALTLAVAVFVAACGGETGGSESSSQAASCGKDGNYLIGMSQANNAEPYRERMNDDIKNAADKVDGFDVKFADAAQDNSKQVSDVENFITQQVDLLIISPNEAKPLTQVVKKAYDKKIPVLVLDRKVEGNGYTSFIGANNEAIGEKAGQAVAKKLLPDGGNVVEIKGLPGATPAQERSAGFKTGIKSNPKVKITKTGVGDWLREKGQSQFEAILQADENIDLVYSHNDPMAEGAYLAAKDAGRQKDMKFVGIDALPIPSGGIKAVEAGRLSETFTYPTGGKEAVAAAKKLLIDCGKVSKTQTLQTQEITPQTAAKVYADLNKK